MRPTRKVQSRCIRTQDSGETETVQHACAASTKSQAEYMAHQESRANPALHGLFLVYVLTRPTLELCMLCEVRRCCGLPTAAVMTVMAATQKIGVQNAQLHHNKMRCTQLLRPMLTLIARPRASETSAQDLSASHGADPTSACPCTGA